MASKRKLPEGIALLSMYDDDEEEDEEMEDLNERPPEGEDSRMELESANRSGDGFPKDGSEAATKRAGIGRVVIVDESEPVGVYVDPFDSFLPPQPKKKCPKELQKQFRKLIRRRIRFNADIRNGKDYRNPDFLLRYQDIDQIGSRFSKQVFDPHGYDKSDYYDEIELAMELFTKSRTTTMPGLTTASGFNAMQPTADLIARDGRHSKKSEWDTMKQIRMPKFRSIPRKNSQSQFRPPPL